MKTIEALFYVDGIFHASKKLLNNEDSDKHAFRLYAFYYNPIISRVRLLFIWSNDASISKVVTLELFSELQLGF